MSAVMIRRVVEREAHVYRRLWRGSVFSSFVVPALFLVAMGLGLGGLVDERTGSIDGLTYLQYVTPGLLVAMAAMAGAGESLWPVMAGFKWLRTYHGITATPVAPRDVFGGHVLWTALRSVLMATVFLAFAALIGGVVSPWAVLAIPAAMLCNASFAAPLAAFSATRDNDTSFSLIMRLIIQPLFLFSGTFFPVTQLPSWIQPFVVISPLWHGVELCRAATTGQGSLPKILLNIAVLVAVVLVSTFIGHRTYTRRLAP